jgi:hypothetical protein
MPEGTGISRMPAATNKTIPQRMSRLRNPKLSAGSLATVLSEGSDEGFSTQSSLDRIYWISQDLQEGLSPVNPIVTSGP